MLRIVFRSYGGENLKGRPAYYSKELALDSFERAYERARAELGGVDRPGQTPSHGIDVTFANDGPIDPALLRRMEALGPVVQTQGGPVGLKASYTFALNLPDRFGWPDSDVVFYLEDDYLLAEDSLVALARAVDAIPQAHYFALSHGRPEDLSDPVQAHQFGTVPWWEPGPDERVDGLQWINILGVTSTFGARIGTLREDKDIFIMCQRPFRNRFLDHETSMLYQGVVPYRGKTYFIGLPGDFVPSVRGVARAFYLLPFRALFNARARRQGARHLLYAPKPIVATHMELEGMTDPARWEAEAHAVRKWAADRKAAAEGADATAS